MGRCRRVFRPISATSRTPRKRRRRLGWLRWCRVRGTSRIPPAVEVHKEQARLATGAIVDAVDAVRSESRARGAITGGGAECLAPPDHGCSADQPGFRATIRTSLTRPSSRVYVADLHCRPSPARTTCGPSGGSPSASNLPRRGGFFRSGRYFLKGRISSSRPGSRRVSSMGGEEGVLRHRRPAHRKDRSIRPCIDVHQHVPAARLQHAECLRYTPALSAMAWGAETDAAGEGGEAGFGGPPCRRGYQSGGDRQSAGLSTIDPPTAKAAAACRGSSVPG